MPVSSTITEALKLGNKAIGVISDNIANAQTPGAHRIEAVATSTAYAGGVSIGLKVNTLRLDGALLSAAVRKSATDAAYDNKINDYFASLEILLGDPAEAQHSNLVKTLDEFIASSGILNQQHDFAICEKFVTQGKNLATAISNVSAEISNLRFKADTELSENCTQINSILSQLFNLNNSISKSGANALALYDTRDSLLNQLSTYLQIQVNFGASGQALISTHDGVISLVSIDSVGQFMYAAATTEESLVQQNATDPIMIQTFNKDGKLVGSDVVYSNNSNSKVSQKIAGGTVCSLIDLRDKYLISSFSAMKDLATAVADGINAIHNSGSTFPPPTNLQSTTMLSYSDFTSWNGKAVINMLNPDGTSINTNSGIFRPVEIDLANISSQFGSGKPTTAAIINEINQLLSFGTSSSRMSMGAIRDQNGNPVADEYLLNDIKLIGRSNIATTGTFTFDLELDGNSYFGSSVEILDVQSGLAGAGLTSVAPGSLPASFSLQKNTHTRTNQPITVSNLQAVPGMQDIRVKIRVTGENGVVEEGTVSFQVDPALNSALMNNRLYGQIPNPALVGNMVQQQGITCAPLATAKLVDDNGVEINGADIFKKGYLVIESANDAYGIIMDDSSSRDLGISGAFGLPIQATNRGFAHYLGFNNFFMLDQLHASLSVRDDIANDVSLLAQGKVSLDAGTNTTLKVGTVAATASVAFQPGNNVNIGDTLQIGNITFTFTNAPANSTDVLIGANLNATLVNLNNAINANSNLKTLIASSFQPMSQTFNFTAKALGSSGNNIAITATFGGVATANINNAGFANNVAGALQGGTDTDKDIVVNNFRLGADSVQIFEEFALLDNKTLTNLMSSMQISTTLHEFSSMASSALAGQILNSRNQAEVSKSVLIRFDKELKEMVSIDQDAEIIKLSSDIVPYMNANYTVFTIYRQIMKDFFEIVR